jgi:PAS domain S-box-containing protein
MSEFPRQETESIAAETRRDLKDRAEALLREKEPALRNPKDRDAREVIQNLQIHQIELEMQNEELRRTQTRLETAVEQYRDLYHQAPVAFVNLDEEGGILEVNRTAADLLGLDRRRLLKTNIFQLLPSSDHDTFYQHCREVSKTRRNVSCELFFHRMDDTAFPARLDIAGIPSETESDFQLRLAITDITAQKAVEAELEARVRERTDELVRTNEALKRQIENRLQIERQLRREHAFRRTIEETVPSGILACDLSGSLIYANRSFCEMAGWTAESLLGRKPPYPFLPPDANPERTRPLAEELRDGVPLHGVATEFLHRDGRRFWGLVFTTDLADGSGNTSGRLVSVIDITARKRSEAELRRSRERLRNLSEKLVAAQDEERRRIARELHDSVGAGLTAIKMGLEAALRKGGDPALLEKTVERLRNVIAETQNISRNLHPSALDDLGLLPAIRGFCRDYRSADSGPTIEHCLDIAEEAIPRSLKLLVFRIVQESVNNAVKHSGADRVTVSLTEADGRIALTLGDDGGGFDVEETLAKEIRHSGLGLSSMKERTELAGGEFEIDSSPGAGTVIRASWKID